MNKIIIKTKKKEKVLYLRGLVNNEAWCRFQGLLLNVVSLLMYAVLGFSSGQLCFALFLTSAVACPSQNAGNSTG